MDDEISKLRSKNSELKKKLDEIVGKSEGEIKALKEQNEELKDKNGKLMEQNGMTIKSQSLHLAAVDNHHTSNQGKKSIENIFSNLTMETAAKEPKNSQKNKVPNWLVEVLAWIKRLEMADSALSSSCWTFKQLCWPKLHGNVKPYKVLEMEISAKSDDDLGTLRAKLIRDNGEEFEDIQIAAVPPPAYIEGFWLIDIKYLDAQVLQFIECISPILDRIYLFFDIQIPFYHFTNERVAKISRLLEMLVSKAADIANKDVVEMMQFHPNAISDNIQRIITSSSDINFLVDWLTKSRSDRQPKLLYYENNYIMRTIIDRIKEHFQGSVESVNFAVMFYNYEVFPAEFAMENEHTNEVLAFYTKREPFHLVYHFIVRHPKGGEHLREDWEKQIHGQNLSSICLDIEKIGAF